MLQLGEAKSAASGILHPAAHQRRHAGLHLWPHRHRLHDGVRHHRHGELRSRRRFHAVGLHRADPSAGAHADAGHHAARARAADRADPGDAAHVAVGVGDRAAGLSAVARLVPAGAADLRHRHVDLPVEPGAGDAGPAQQAGAGNPERRLHLRRSRRLHGDAVLQADPDRGGDRRSAGGVLVRRADDLDRPGPAGLRAGPQNGGAARRRRRPDHLAHVRDGRGAGRRRRPAVHDLLRRRPLQRRLRPRA